MAALSQYRFTLDQVSLERSIVHFGHQSSAALLQKLDDGKPITVGVLGASVSLNGGCNAQPSRRCQEFDGKHMKLCTWGEPRTRPFKGFYVKFMDVVNATWPNAKHRLNNSAADTTPPQNFLDYCFFSHLPMPLDLMILEFGSMAASANFAGVEAIVRLLLSLRDPPAIAFLTVREWCHASVKPWGSAPPFGPSTPTKHARAEAAFEELCAHYNQTCLSYHRALAPHFFARRANFTMADIAGDCLHPNRGRLGNDYMSDLLVHYLKVAAAAQRDALDLGRRPRFAHTPTFGALPPPHFDETRVRADQARAHNERCYGFGALGGTQRQRYQRLLSAPWSTARCHPLVGGDGGGGDADYGPSLASLRSLCAWEAHPMECPTRVAQAARVEAPLRSLRVWAFCRQPLLSAAAAAAAAKNRKPSKRSPGLLALAPGATLFLTVDTRLAEFASSATAAAANSHAPLHAKLQYLVSTSGLMGTASVQCVPSSGCTCPMQIIDAHRPLALTGAGGSASPTGTAPPKSGSDAGAYETHYFSLRGASPTCTVIVRVLNASRSGGHAFRVRQFTLTASDARAEGTSQLAFSPKTYEKAKRERVKRRQREMIKGSY